MPLSHFEPIVFHVGRVGKRAMRKLVQSGVTNGLDRVYIYLISIQNISVILDFNDGTYR